MNASQLIEDRCGNTGSKLRFEGETIRWTQLLAVIEQDMVFAAKKRNIHKLGELWWS